MASYEHILDRLTEQIRPMAGDEVELSQDTDLIDELGLDSVLVMDLVLEIEDEFDVSVPVNVLADVRTLGDLANAIQQLSEED